MKTVMKKMFCLLLVAVMLVGVMPFAAFADGEGTPCADCGQIHDASVECCKTCHQTGHDESEKHCTDPNCGWYVGHSGDCTSECDQTATCGWDKAHKETCIKAHPCTHCGAGADHLTANCPNYCTKCKQEGHDESEEHCTVCGWYTGHKEGCTNWKCETCGQTKHDDTVKCCATCKETGHATTDPHCTHCNKAGNQHPDSCPNSPKYYSTCNKCTTKYVTVNKHPECTVCGNVNASATNTCHDTADCPYCSICWKNGDVVKTHKASAHCEKCGETSHKTADHCTTCGNTNGTHKVTCKYYTNAQTGSSKVKVYVNLYTSDVKTETKHLYTYENVSKDTPVYAFIAEQSEHIRSLLPSGYTWGGNVYDSQNDDDAELMKGKVGSGTTVHINAYSAQDLVYIYVHNSRSFSNLRIVQLHGKKVGETVTKQEVTKAVSKYFNVSGLSMYDEQAWEDYVDGASVESVASLKVTNDPYFIDVRISGTAKSGTSGSGYTADSSNPKTGDAIFAPVMILGLSASALAVLFYLNKKRAF